MAQARFKVLNLNSPFIQGIDCFTNKGVSKAGYLRAYLGS